jgi:hypothetical protein
MGKKGKKIKTGRVKDLLEDEKHLRMNSRETQPEFSGKISDLRRSEPEDLEEEMDDDDEENSYDLSRDEHDDLAEDQGGINL